MTIPERIAEMDRLAENARTVAQNASFNAAIFEAEAKRLREQGRGLK
jgi:hypothetical protein